MTMSSRPASGTKSLIIGERLSVRFPQPDRRHLCKRADRLAQASAYRFHARDERSAHGAHAGNQDSELPFGGRNLHWFLFRQIDYSLSQFLIL